MGCELATVGKNFTEQNIMNISYTDGCLLTDVYLMRVNVAEYKISEDMIIKSIGDGFSMIQTPAENNK